MESVPAAGWRPGEQPLPPEGPTLFLTRFPAPARWATRGQFGPVTWAQLLEHASQPELWPGGGSVDAASALLPAWSFARYREDTRVVLRDEALAHRETALRVEEVHGLVVEYEDEPALDATHLQRWWGAYTFVAHTTGFHEQPWGEKPPGPRWRLWVPFARAVALDVAARIGEWARHPRRAVGIVADRSLDAVRAAEVPAIGPGGYRWLAGIGAPVDPERALTELASWAEQDRQLRAADLLAGTAIAEVADRFTQRHHTAERHPFFPLPGGAGPLAQSGALTPTTTHPSWGPLGELLVGMWPGRVVLVLGTSGSGRGAFALQLAAEVARARHPVLYVLTRMGTDEGVARLVAARSEHLGAVELLQGAGSATNVDDGVRHLIDDAPGLHLWSPPAPERTRDELFRRIRAVSDAHQGRPPLVVVDAVEGWATEDPERGLRELGATLRDAAHGAVLGQDWPGAAVVMVSAAPPGAHLRSADALQAAWDGGALGGLGPLEHDVHVVLVLATDAPGPSVRDVRHSTIVVARNRDGRCGAVSMGFEPVSGRFSAVPPG